MSDICIGVIGDIVGSREVRGGERAHLQEAFGRAVDRVNDRYRASILSRFVITTGDEFQGLLHDAAVIPDLVWTVERRLHPRRLRLGFGRGTLDTPLAPEAIGMDGPVWHEARRAIEAAEAGRGQGIRFAGFGEILDPTLDALSRLLHLVRDRWTDRQREVSGWLRGGRTHEEVAAELGISRQAVTQHAAAASWDAYDEGERALRLLLSQFDYTAAWQGGPEAGSGRS